MIIRREQLEQFIAPDDGALSNVVRAAVRVANGSRVAAYSDQELDGMVKIGIERARGRGMKFAEDISAFVAVMFEVAPRFDEQAEISAALVNEALPLDVRLEMLFSVTQDTAWVDAEKKYEDSFWFGD